MNRLLLTFVLFLLMTQLVFAAQTYVIGEMFTTTTCGYCHPARSALADFYNDIEDYPYFIPLIWQGNGAHISPGYNDRRTLYGFTGIPHCRFNGNIAVGGYAADAQYQRYVNAYTQAVYRNAPMEIIVRMKLEDNDLTVFADVTMTNNITTENNNIIFVLTYNLEGIMDPNYFASVKTYHSQSFPLDEQGQEQTFSRVHTWDPSWEMDRINAIVFVQSFDSVNPIVHQAGQRSGRGITSVFNSNVQQGPPDLHVSFFNSSGPAHLINSYKWDFTGDGEIDSTEENPTFVYKEPGTYTVTLTVSDGVEKAVMELEDHITVLEPNTVYGEISSSLKKVHSPYTIIGDVTVPENGFLKAESGVEIFIEGSSIAVTGLLELEGSSDEPVLLTSNSSWEGLTLTESEDDNIIKNVIFTKAAGTALTIDNSTIKNFSNNFFANNGNAGAMRVLQSDMDISNSLFVNNESSVSVIHFAGSTVNFVNNTISHNSIAGDGQSHILNEDTFLQIKNCIIRGQGNSIINIGEGMTMAEYSNISGGFDGLFVIDEDPLFVAPSEGDGVEYDGPEAVWYLQENSPCIDTGNPSQEYNDPEDPENPGFALFPAMGSVRNDMGAFGGSGTLFWVGIDDEQFIYTPKMNMRITAYPNPFNPNVTISLANITFNKEKPVTLCIYNTKGQLVNTILNNELIRRDKYFWSGIDNFGNNVPSGVYLINFTTDRLQVSEKILLLK